MKIRVVGVKCMIEGALISPGDVVDLADEGIARRLIMAGCAVAADSVSVASSSAPVVETATLADAAENTDSASRGKGRRK